MAWRSDTVLLESSSVFDFLIRHHEHRYPSMIITFEDSRRRRHLFEVKLPLAGFSIRKPVERSVEENI